MLSQVDLPGWMYTWPIDWRFLIHLWYTHTQNQRNVISVIRWHYDDIKGVFASQVFSRYLLVSSNKDCSAKIVVTMFIRNAQKEFLEIVQEKFQLEARERVLDPKSLMTEPRRKVTRNPESCCLQTVRTLSSPWTTLTATWTTWQLSSVPVTSQCRGWSRVSDR